MRKKSMWFIVKCTPYPFEILFSFGQSDLEIKNILKRYELHESPKMYQYTNDQTPACYRMSVTNHSLIRMRKIPVTNGDYAILQHELLHAVIAILETVGITLHDSSEEAYTYLLQYLTLTVYNKF